MRSFLAVTVLCATLALAQYGYEDEYDDELQARDVRDSVWKAARGGERAPAYRGFEEMAQHYPGHPAKAHGAKHHARDVEDDSEGFIDNAASFANNIARAVKTAKEQVEKKTKESVKHAKAKAKAKAKHEADHDGHQWGPAVGQHHGAGQWPKNGAHPGFGGPWGKPSKRDADDEEVGEPPEELPNVVDDIDYENGGLAERDVEDEEFDVGEPSDDLPNTGDYEDYDSSDISARDVDGEDEEDVGEPPEDLPVVEDDESSAGLAERDVDEEEEEYFEGEPPEDLPVVEDDESSAGLAERDVEGEEDEDVGEPGDDIPFVGDFGDYDSEGLAERDVEEDDDAPAATAFDDDDEDLPDPKLQLEQEFDEGIDEDDEDNSGVFERDAEPEPWSLFGWGGKKDEHKDAHHDEHEAWKKGMKHIIARDSGVSADEDLDGAYDSVAEDPDIDDDEFYAAYAGDGDLDDDQIVEKRSMPHMIWGTVKPESDVHTATKHKTTTKSKSASFTTHRSPTGTKKVSTKKTHAPTPKKTKAPEPPAYRGWFPWA